MVRFPCRGGVALCCRPSKGSAPRCCVRRLLVTHPMRCRILLQLEPMPAQCARLHSKAFMVGWQSAIQPRNTPHQTIDVIGMCSKPMSGAIRLPHLAYQLPNGDRSPMPLVQRVAEERRVFLAAFRCVSPIYQGSLTSIKKHRAFSHQSTRASAISTSRLSSPDPHRLQAIIIGNTTP